MLCDSTIPSTSSVIYSSWQQSKNWEIFQQLSLEYQFIAELTNNEEIITKIVVYNIEAITINTYSGTITIQNLGIHDDIVLLYGNLKNIYQQYFMKVKNTDITPSGQIHLHYQLKGSIGTINKSKKIQLQPTPHSQHQRQRQIILEKLTKYKKKRDGHHEAQKGDTVYQNDVIEQRVNQILEKMTLEEKIGQMNQQSGVNFTGPQGDTIDISDYIAQGKLGSVLNVSGAALVYKYQKIAIEKSRLKIPLLFGLDVIHGYKTVFPVPIAMASSWDVQMVRMAQQIARNQASSSGINWTFTPMIDIARDPRWGRLVEGFGEDPYLSSVLAKVSVEAFQGKSLSDKTSILATGKHYVGYGASQGGRDYFTVDISQRTLWQVYLPPFISAIQAKVCSIMPAFTTMNGIPMTANHQLLTNILRNNLNFKGITVSDWNAINQIIQWHAAATQKQAVKLSIQASVDIDMVGNAYENQLSGLVENNQVSASLIDEAVRRILRKKIELGLFDNPFKYCDEKRQAVELLSHQNRKRARQAGQKSIVLLKNTDHILPLSKKLKSIAVVGPLAASKYQPLGPWFCNGQKNDTVSVLQGIKQAVEGHTKILYHKGCQLDSEDTSMIIPAVNAVAQAEVIIAVAGEGLSMSGEAACRSDINLPKPQQALLQALYQTGIPIILILMNGRPLTINWADKYIPCILQTWFAGTQAGHCIADIIFGEFNPCGKLPITFPRSTGQIPIFYSHLNTGRPATQQTKMQKYVSKYVDIDNSPLYPFGYGLSYTQFAYSALKMSSEQITENEKVYVSIDIRNVGKVYGEEIVQLYIEKTVSFIARPIQLKGFKKLGISPGKEKTVTFEIGFEQLSLYNSKMQQVVEKGKYHICIGPNSVSLQKTILSII